MNQKNREQLRAAILDNLVQGKQAHSPTRDLLKQYRPLKGILTPVLEQEAEATSDDPSDANAPVEKAYGRWCHRGTERNLTLARCHGGACCYPGTQCHPGILCRGEGRTESAKHD